MELIFDIFSGRPNPSIRLPALISRKVFDLINDIGLLPCISPEFFPSRLGYRGLKINLPTELVTKYRVPPWINLPADTIGHIKLIKELASVVQFLGFLGIDELRRVLKLIIEVLDRINSKPGAKPPPPTGPCGFEMLPYDPDPWNDPAFKPTNNCYAYAANKRAAYRAKPQPGIGSGSMFASLSAADVSAAAKRDGAHDVNDCFPDSEAPRLLVALVIWPGEDYHWYRKHPNCWGHKPGSTDARNVDSSNAVITDPQSCDRGPYTEFYGYMLIPKSQKVAA
jgi:hypothetical protein